MSDSDNGPILLDDSDDGPNLPDDSDDGPIILDDSDDGPIPPDDTEFETEYPETEQVPQDKWNPTPIESSKDPDVIKANQNISQMKALGNLSKHERTEDRLAWEKFERGQNPVRYNRADHGYNNQITMEELMQLLMENIEHYELIANPDRNELCLDRHGRATHLQDLADELKEQCDQEEQKEEAMDENGLKKIKTIINKFKQEICINENCAICLEKNSKTIQTKCAHYFCPNCLEESLKKCGFCCPVCRELIQ